MTSDDTADFLAALQCRDDERKRVAKLVNIDIQETSAVRHPAHLAEGWLIAKSAGPIPHDHRADALYLGEGQQHTAKLLDLKPGEEMELAAGRALGKSDCGCLYVKSPESVAKAAGEDYLRQRENALAKDAGPRYTAEDLAYLTAYTNKVLGRS